jgi:hypothetical protein
MPEPDRDRLGSRHVRLDPEAVHFLPSRVEAWRGIEPVSIRYADVVSVVMTEPRGRGRGRLIVRLVNGESHSMSFGVNRLPRLRPVYRELWRRVQAARGEPGPG